MNFRKEYFVKNDPSSLSILSGSIFSKKMLMENKASNYSSLFDNEAENVNEEVHCQFNGKNNSEIIPKNKIKEGLILRNHFNKFCNKNESRINVEKSIVLLNSINSNEDKQILSKENQGITNHFNQKKVGSFISIVKSRKNEQELSQTKSQNILLPQILNRNENEKQISFYQNPYNKNGNKNRGKSRIELLKESTKNQDYIEPHFNKIKSDSLNNCSYDKIIKNASKESIP